MTDYVLYYLYTYRLTAVAYPGGKLLINNTIFINKLFSDKICQTLVYKKV